MSEGNTNSLLSLMHKHFFKRKFLKTNIKEEEVEDEDEDEDEESFL